MLATSSDRSTGSRATVPVSASAMLSSASSVLRMRSTSVVTRSSTRRSGDAVRELSIAASAVACSRFSGVRKSCAAESSTVRMPSVNCSILSSMRLISAPAC